MSDENPTWHTLFQTNIYRPPADAIYGASQNGPGQDSEIKAILKDEDPNSFK